MAAAMVTKLMSVFRKAPMRISASPTWMTQVEKSGMPKIPSSGVMMSVTRDVTMAPKAAPMTTATARSTMLPRKQEVPEPLDHDLPPRSVRHGSLGQRLD